MHEALQVPKPEIGDRGNVCVRKRFRIFAASARNMWPSLPESAMRSSRSREAHEGAAMPTGALVMSLCVVVPDSQPTAGIAIEHEACHDADDEDDESSRAVLPMAM